jgi:pimeloyl-ACP methyl ester carboxylesterase
MARPFPPAPGVSHAFHDVATGIRLHVAEAGPEDGPPVVLLHGWPQHWWCWRGVIGPLADAGFRVIAPDLRGSGWSDAPPTGYDKEQFASDVLALLDAMGIERTAFVGHDWGGWTGQLVALRAPERISQLVLCNIAPVWGAPKLEMARNAWRYGYQVVGVPKLGPALQRSGLFRRSLPIPDPAARAEFAAAMREPQRAEAGSLIYRTFVTQEAPALLRGRYDAQRLTMPTLVLHGTADPVIRPFQVEVFREHADDLRIEWVHGTGHFIADEEPALVAEHVLAFLGTGTRADGRHG